MQNHWDERYSEPAFAYGEAPNAYLETHLPQYAAGSILLPADGEGRNGVHAATLGWEVSAFDQSGEGKKKAEQLARRKGVSIHYDVSECSALTYAPAQFDAMALIYAHFSAETKSAYHRQLSAYVRTGGIVIFEAFSKKHLAYKAQNPRVGGPGDEGMLFSLDELRADFADYDIIELYETEVALQEGVYHNGLGSVVRFVGRKKG